MLLVSNINVPPESEECVVEGIALVYGVVHTSHTHTLFMPHITLLKPCDSISIQVSMSLDHYATTTEGHG